MAGLWTEFKTFAVKGNMVDMAVGILIGAAFSGVVNSLVEDLIMPPLGLLTGGLDLSEQYLLLRAGVENPGPYETVTAAREAGAVLLSWGAFVNSLTSFFIIAGVLFFAVRWINNLRAPETPPAPTQRPCPHCTTPIHRAASRCPACTSPVKPLESAPPLATES